MTKWTAGAVGTLAVVGLALGLLLAGAVKARSAAARLAGQGQSDRKPLEMHPAANDVTDQPSEPKDARARSARRAKSRRYDKKTERAKRLTELPDGGGVVRGGESPELPPLPVAQSDAVIIGTIVKAQSHLTESETGIYTEFAVRVEEVFKNDGLADATPGGTVEVDREAGAMRLRDGRVVRYETGGLGGLPRAGRRYVLFLKRVNDGRDISIHTAYELRQRRVTPLDGVTRVFDPTTGQITRKAPFENVEEATFFELLRAAVANPNRVLMPEGLRNDFSHEVAHNFGLNHTANGSLSNQTASSLYNTANGLNDTTTRAPGPTNCDRQVINATYGSGGVRYTAPLRPGGGGYEGGGEGYYPCTPYYWYYYESENGESWQLVDVSYAGCW